MALGSNNPFPKVILVEQGSTPANPSAGAQKLFIDSVDHHVKRVNSSGVVVDVEGAASALVLDDLVDVDVPSPTDGDVLTYSSASPSGWVNAAPSSGSGDVVGPGSAVNDRIAVFDGTTGKLIKDGGQTIASIVGGAGGMVLLEQHTASSSASLDFTTCITSTYDEYQIELVNLVPATNSVNLLMRFSTNGGSSYDSGSNYFTDGLSWRAAAAPGIGGGSGTSINITAANSLTIGNDSKYGVSGTLKLYSPLSTSLYKQVTSGNIATIYTDNATRIVLMLAGQYTSLTAANAFQFIMSSGNIASGVVRVYGLAK